MIWLYLVGGIALGMVVEAFVRFRRSKSPVDIYQEQERRAELAAAAGTMDEVRLLVAERQKIAAIKAFREQTNSGLREAKDAVEALEREMRAEGELS